MVIIVIIVFFAQKQIVGVVYFSDKPKYAHEEEKLWYIYSRLHYLVDGNVVVSPEGQPSLTKIVCYDRFNWINCFCSIQLHRTRQVVAI